MKKLNQKKETLDHGYIPFNLNKINENNKLNTILLLSDGSHFFGTSFGSKKRSIGELCFNTSLTGYQEIITDPSYAGQIITFTFPHIGNIGSNNADNEGKTNSVAGIVVKQPPTSPSNWRSEKSLNDWLIFNDIPGISGIDTRLLTKTIRKYKSCNAMICYNENGIFDLNKLKAELIKHPKMDGLNLSSSVTTKKEYRFNEHPHELLSTKILNNKNFKPKIVVIDFGVKRNILRHLVNLNADVVVFPEDTDSKKIQNCKPDGIFLSNGPGDPAATEKKCKKLLNSIFKLDIPVFVICIGHQLIGLSFGAKTSKMSQGHRGANHPVKNLSNKKVEITSQNHGYKIHIETLPKCF